MATDSQRAYQQRRAKTLRTAQELVYKRKRDRLFGQGYLRKRKAKPKKGRRPGYADPTTGGARAPGPRRAYPKY